jgi:hypothetical protein
MIRRVHYSSNNFQAQQKKNITKKKTLGYLPRVLFFNAFQLGAESENQVFSIEEASRPDALHIPLLPLLLPLGTWWGSELHGAFSHIYYCSHEF